MEDFKNRMNKYEVTPPKDVWEVIAGKLDSNEATVFSITKKRPTTFYYVAAASIALIIFCVLLFRNQSSNIENDQLITTSNEYKPNDTLLANTVIMTIPVEERQSEKERLANAKSTGKNKKTENLSENKKAIQKQESTDNNLIAANTARYITIEGPQGQPVKISSKMATLIDSSETKVSSKPVWNKKIDEWREIMKVNTLAPTTGNFLDIVELTKTLHKN